MEPITKKIRKTNECSLFHDTKGDMSTLTTYCNMLADKINELNEELQETKRNLKRSVNLVFKQQIKF